MSEVEKTNKKKPVTEQWWFWVSILISICIICIIFDSFSDSDTNNTVSTSTNIKQENTQTKEPVKPEETKEEYISKCETYKYKDIARNPNSYIGKRIKLSGQVIQVQEKFFNKIALIVNVTKGEYGFWEDAIYVNYKHTDDNESKISERDIITIYGECNGQKSYISQLGLQVTIPYVEAKYINIQ